MHIHWWCYHNFSFKILKESKKLTKINQLKGWKILPHSIPCIVCTMILCLVSPTFAMSPHKSKTSIWNEKRLIDIWLPYWLIEILVTEEFLYFPLHWLNPCDNTSDVNQVDPNYAGYKAYQIYEKLMKNGTVKTNFN